MATEKYYNVNRCVCVCVCVYNEHVKEKYIKMYVIPASVGFVMEKAIGLEFLRVLRFTLSDSFHQCFILIRSSVSDVVQFQQLAASLNNRFKITKIFLK